MAARAARARPPRRRRCPSASCARASRTCRRRRRCSSASFDLIAEVKLRSPAVGLLKAAAEEDVGARVATYARAGAAAVSILTEPSRFDGSLDDLRDGAAALRAARRAGHAQGFPGRRLPGARRPCRGRGRRARHPAHAAAYATSSSSSTRRWSCACSCCSRPSTSPTSSSRMRWSDARRAHRELLLVGVNSRDLVTLKVVPGRLDALAASLPQRRETRCRERRGHGRGRGARRRLRLRPRAGGQRADVGRGSGGAGARHARRRPRGAWHARRPDAGRAWRTQAVHQDLRHDHAARRWHAALACEVDAIGFVFAPSVRHVDHRSAPTSSRLPARHRWPAWP